MSINHPKAGSPGPCHVRPARRAAVLHEPADPERARAPSCLDLPVSIGWKKKLLVASASLLVTSASLLVTSALLVVTRSY